MGTHVLGFQSFLAFLHYFVLPKLATSSIRVKVLGDDWVTCAGSIFFDH